MTQVKTGKDCGNSPKNRLLQNLVIAFARADVAEISNVVTSDVCWRPAGSKPVSGIEAFCRAIARHGPATRITIEHVISHGRAGAVNGVMEFGTRQQAFCYVFEFASAKATHVRAITSYSAALA